MLPNRFPSDRLVERCPQVRIGALKGLLPCHPSAKNEIVQINEHSVAIVRDTLGRPHFQCADCGRRCNVIHLVERKLTCRRCGGLDYTSRRDRMTLRGLRVSVVAALKRAGDEKTARVLKP